MRSPILRAFLPGAFFRELDRFLRHFNFRKFALAGERFDRVTVAIARRKIHLTIDAGRLAPQRVLDQTQGLHERLPIDRAQETQAGDAVADRDLVGSLALTLLVHELLDGKSLLGQSLFEPAPGKM